MRVYFTLALLGLSCLYSQAIILTNTIIVFSNTVSGATFVISNGVAYGDGTGLINLSGRPVIKGISTVITTNATSYGVSLAYPTLYVSPYGLTNNLGTPLFPLPMPYALTVVGGGRLIALTNFPASSYWDLTATNSGLTIEPVGYPNNCWNVFLQVTNSAAASIFIEPGVSNVTVQGMEILNNTNQDAIKFVGAINTTLRDNYLHNNVGNGMLGTAINIALIERNLMVGNGTNNTDVGHFHGSYLQGTNITYRNNVAYDQTNGYGAQFYPSNNVNLLVYNNLLFKNNRGMVISVEAGLTNYAFNNTIISNTSTAVQLYGTTTGTVYLTNNIILNNGNGSIASAGGLTVIEDYNVVESAVSSPGTHDVVATSVSVVNGAGGLYWLTYSSVARNAAVNQPPPVDFFGYPQTSVADIGAFQYGPDNWKSFDTRTLYQSAFPAYWDVKATLPEAYVATNTITAEIVASTNAATLGTQLKSMTNTATLGAQGLSLKTELVSATNTATLHSQGLALGTELVSATNTTTLFTQMAGQSPSFNMVNMTNFAQPLLSFASDSNAIVLNSGQYRYTAARAVGVTNIILPDTTHAWYSTMTVTNPLGTTITNFCICAGLKPEGYVATNAAAVIGFNGLVVPIGGVVDITFKYDGYSTNYMGMYK